MSEQDWIRNIHDGDESAFEAMFRSYFDKLTAFAFSYVGSRDRAEDVVEDVFFNIWRARETWEVSGSLRAYLYTATRNQALNARKRLGLERRHLEMVASQPPRRASPADAEMLGEEARAAAEQAIAGLPERCREIFLLHREHNLSYAEIAAATGVTTKTVENQLGRAVKLLREKLWGFLNP